MIDIDTTPGRFQRLAEKGTQAEIASWLQRRPDGWSEQLEGDLDTYTVARAEGGGFFVDSRSDGESDTMGSFDAAYTVARIAARTEPGFSWDPDRILIQLLAYCADGNAHRAATLADELARAIRQRHAPNQVADMGEDGFHVASVAQWRESREAEGWE